MKQYLLSLCLLIATQISFSQEAMINDIKSCENIFFYRSELIKQIKKEKDTINCYHDGELAIYYNHKKTKWLKANTFYIINHGFNKLLTFRVLLLELELVDNENRKSTILTGPGNFTLGVYEDSLRRSTSMAITIDINPGIYKKATVKSYRVEISYYGISIYRWFLKEGELIIPTTPA